jgi:hypothetical protein
LRSKEWRSQDRDCHSRSRSFAMTIFPIQGFEIKLTPTPDPCVRRRAYFILKTALTSMDA